MHYIDFVLQRFKAEFDTIAMMSMTLSMLLSMLL